MDEISTAIEILQKVLTGEQTNTARLLDTRWSQLQNLTTIAQQCSFCLFFGHHLTTIAIFDCHYPKNSV